MLSLNVYFSLHDFCSSIILRSMRRSRAKICQKFQLRHSKKMNKWTLTWTCLMCQPRLQLLQKRKRIHQKPLRRLKVFPFCSYFPMSFHLHMLSGLPFQKKVHIEKERNIILPLPLWKGKKRWSWLVFSMIRSLPFSKGYPKLVV